MKLTLVHQQGEPSQQKDAVAAAHHVAVHLSRVESAVVVGSVMVAFGLLLVAHALYDTAAEPER